MSIMGVIAQSEDKISRNIVYGKRITGIEQHMQQQELHIQPTSCFVAQEKPIYRIYIYISGFP